MSPSGKARQPPGGERGAGLQGVEKRRSHHRTANASCLPLPRPLHIARVALGPSSLVANQRRNVVMAVHYSIVTGSPTGKCIRRFLSDFPSRKPFFLVRILCTATTSRPASYLLRWSFLHRSCCSDGDWDLGFAFAAPAASWERTRDKRPLGRAASCMHASDHEIHR